LWLAQPGLQKISVPILSKRSVITPRPLEVCTKLRTIVKEYPGIVPILCFSAKNVLMRSEPIMDSDHIPLVDLSPENPLCAKKVPAIPDDAAANDDCANRDDNTFIEAESASHNNLTQSDNEIGAKNDIDHDDNKFIDADSASHHSLTQSGGAKNDTIDRDENEPMENLDESIFMDSLALQTLMVWEPSLTLTDT
jgi:hypothetical protein